MAKKKMVTYKIVRFCQNPDNPNHQKIIQEGLTLEEAQEWCTRKDTEERGKWFDGYRQE